MVYTHFYYATQIFGSSYLQRISGDGLFCLEIQESCPDEPTVLFPGETITVEARRIIAMSESISILDAWKVSDKKTLKYGNSFYLHYR